MKSYMINSYTKDEIDAKTKQKKKKKLKQKPQTNQKKNN